MPAAVDVSAIVQAIGGHWGPMIFAAVTPGAVTGRHVELLTKICSRLGSDHHGERAAAGLLGDQFIRWLGHTWESLLAPLAPTPSGAADDVEHLEFWAEAIRRCQARPELLLPREGEFLASVARWTARGRLPSQKQQRWVLDILLRAGR